MKSWSSNPIDVREKTRLPTSQQIVVEYIIAINVRTLHTYGMIFDCKHRALPKHNYVSDFKFLRPHIRRLNVSIKGISNGLRQSMGFMVEYLSISKIIDNFRDTVLSIYRDFVSSYNFGICKHMKLCAYKSYRPHISFSFLRTTWPLAGETFICFQYHHTTRRFLSRNCFLI